MPFNRNQITRLTALNPVERHYDDEDPKRSEAADDMDKAHMGYHVLDRARPMSFDRQRRGLTPPVELEPNVGYDDLVPGRVIY